MKYINNISKKVKYININIIRWIVSSILRKPLVWLVDFDGEINLRIVRNIIYGAPGTKGPYSVGICKRMAFVPESDCVLLSDGTVRRKDGASHFVKRWHYFDGKK